MAIMPPGTPTTDFWTAADTASELARGVDERADAPLRAMNAMLRPAARNDIEAGLAITIASTHREASPKAEVWYPALVVENEHVLNRPVARAFVAESKAKELPFSVIISGRVSTFADPGASVGVLGGFAGTLGGITDENTAAQLGLTAGHVFAQPVGTGVLSTVFNRDRVIRQGSSCGNAAVFQPAPADGQANSRIGAIAVVNELRRRRNRADVGLIRLDGAAGTVVALGAVSDPDLAGRTVEKTGKTTGKTTGSVTRVRGMGVSVWMGGPRPKFDELFAVEGTDGAFSSPGDSGALVMDAATGEVLGMVLAGSPAGGINGGPLTWAVPGRNVRGTIADLEGTY